MDGIRQQRNWATADAYPRRGLTTPARLARVPRELSAAPPGLGIFGLEYMGSFGFRPDKREIERQTRPLPGQTRVERTGFVWIGF